MEDLALDRLVPGSLSSLEKRRGTREPASTEVHMAEQSHTVPGPRVGDGAPDFTLRHTFERTVNLHSTLVGGPVLLAFYVFDFGPL